MRISDWSSDVCSSDLEDSVDIKDSNSASRWRRARTRAEKSMAYGRRTRAHIAADRNMEHAPDKALERLSRSEVGSGSAEPAQPGRAVLGDRKSVGTGKSVAVSVDPGGPLIIKKKHYRNQY